MRNKLKAWLALGACSSIAGGLWIYQATVFEKSFYRQLSVIQEFLEEYNVHFTYEAVRLSPYLFKAQIINPTISGKIPPIKGYYEEESQADCTLKGVMNVSFSPFANAIHFSQQGESIYNMEGPVNLKLVSPSFFESTITLYRHHYDFFGRQPFLGLDNIKKICSDSKDMSFILNGEKFIEMKGNYSEINFNKKGNLLEGDLISNTQGMQFFPLKKPLEGKTKNIEISSIMFSNEILGHALLGPEDQKLSLTFQVRDFDSYLKGVKNIVLTKNTSKEEALEKINKIFPEGLSVELKEFTVTNKVYESTTKANLARGSDRFSIGYSTDFKVTDEWENYCQYYHNKLVMILSDLNLSSDNLAHLKSEKFLKDVIPHLQHFGRIHFSISLDTPLPWSLETGNASIHFKSDLYNVGVEGGLNNSGSKVKVMTRNIMPLTKDLENYATRVEQALPQSLAKDLPAYQVYFKAGVKVLEKVLEPEGAVDQQVDIQMNPEKGIQVGKYDVAGLLNLFNETISPLAPSQTTRTAA